MSHCQFRYVVIRSDRNLSARRPLRVSN